METEHPLSDRKQIEPLIPGEKVLVIQPLLVKMMGGLNEALILNQLHYWTQHSKNERDGFKWVYKTYDAWNLELPFISNATIRRAIKNLEENGLIISANYNRMGIDKTKWYRIDYEKIRLLSIAQNEQMECSKRADELLKMSSPVVQNEQTIDSKRANELLTMSNQTAQNEQTNNHRLLQYTTSDNITDITSSKSTTEKTDRDYFEAAAPSITNSVNSSDEGQSVSRSVSDSKISDKENSSSLSSFHGIERVRESYSFAFGELSEKDSVELVVIAKMYKDHKLVCEAIRTISEQETIPNNPINEIPALLSEWRSKGINSYEQLLLKTSS